MTPLVTLHHFTNPLWIADAETDADLRALAAAALSNQPGPRQVAVKLSVGRWREPCLVSVLRK